MEAGLGTHQPIAHTVLFWALSALGIAAALPCFLVPPIEAYCGLLQVERREQAITQHLQSLIDRQDRLCEAIRTDPLVNTRLAMRELGRRPAGQQVQYLARGGLQAPPADRAALADLESAPEAPNWIEQLYPARWAMVYRDARSRQIILVLSVLLIVSALQLYTPRCR